MALRRAALVALRSGAARTAPQAWQTGGRTFSAAAEGGSVSGATALGG